MSGRALMSPYDRSEHGYLGDANRTELGDWESAGFYSVGTTRLCLTHYLRVGNYLSRDYASLSEEKPAGMYLACSITVF